MNFLSRFIRHQVQVMDNPDQPPEGVTDVPPSPSNDEEPPSPGLQRSGHHHVLSTCAVHVQWWSKVLTHHADFSNSEGLGCKLLNFWSRTSESGRIVK